MGSDFSFQRMSALEVAHQQVKGEGEDADDDAHD